MPPNAPKWLTSEYWQGRFREQDTPWELGHPSVVLMEAFDELSHLGAPLVGMRVLSPGTGRGSDALELGKRGAEVIAVDWSEIAVNDLKHRIASLSPHIGRIEILFGDLFQIAPREVDCVAEHTFFCAIDPSARRRYVERLAEWVKPGGYLVGNFFVLSDEAAAALPALSLTQSGEGPPFATTVKELDELMSPLFEKVVLRQAKLQEPDRRPGMEWVGIFKRSTSRR